eukprot:871785-Alexandrium_andersonii.AAC.1
MANEALVVANEASPGGLPPPPDLPDWRLRRERPHRGGATAPPDPPTGASSAPKAPVGGVRGAVAPPERL